jgi:hypothetical protein
MKDDCCTYCKKHDNCTDSCEMLICTYALSHFCEDCQGFIKRKRSFSKQQLLEGIGKTIKMIEKCINNNDTISALQISTYTIEFIDKELTHNL